MKFQSFLKLLGLSTLVTLFVVAALTSCSSDDELSADGGQAPSGEKMIPFTATIGAKGSGQGTRALTPGDNQIITTWDVDDKVAVVFGDAKYTATVTAVSTSGTATVKGEVPEGTANGQDVQLIFPASAVTDAGAVKTDLLSLQKGTLADIADNYDLSIAEGTLAVSNNSATLSEQVDFENQHAICKFQFKDRDNSNAAITGITKLVICDNSDDVLYTAMLESAASEVYVAMAPIATSTKLKFKACTETNKDFGYVGTANTQIEASGYYVTTLGLTDATPPDISPGGAEAVDLGLSVKWANMNIGATSEGEYGDYFAWGATEPWYSSLDPLTWKDGKTGYNWASYHYGTSRSSITKYISNSYYVDYKTTLEAADDAASVNWGGTWRMPTRAELNELCATESNSAYTWTWTTADGHNGYRITQNSTGNNIFLPAAGFGLDTDLYVVGTDGAYWSSSLDMSHANNAFEFSFGSDYFSVDYTSDRCIGLSVRAVKP